MSADDEYRVARQAQDKRYEDAIGLSVGDTDRQEYRDYFGEGFFAGDPVERRLNYKDWLRDHKHEQPGQGCISEGQAKLLTGRDLAELAGQGDYVAGNEIVRRAVKRASKRQVAA